MRTRYPDASRRRRAPVTADECIIRVGPLHSVGPLRRSLFVIPAQARHLRAFRALRTGRWATDMTDMTDIFIVERQWS